MRRNIRRAGSIVATLALATLPLCMLAGCAEEEFDQEEFQQGIEGLSAESLIQQSIASELQNAILEDETGIADAIVNTSLADLAQYGIDGVEYLQNYLGELDYDLGDIVVDGETATVEVTLNYNSIGALASQIGNDLTVFLAGIDLEQLPLEEIGSLLSPILTATANAIGETISQNMMLDLELVNGEWQLTDESKLNVTNALLEG